ncbi:hypothetical protein N9R79_12570 [Vibrio sp.]|nr:hypothetical protein [Vibrio sp.]
MKGSGTELDPYYVASLEEAQVAGGLGGHIQLIHDLDLLTLKYSQVFVVEHRLNLGGFSLLINTRESQDHSIRVVGSSYFKEGRLVLPSTDSNIIISGGESTKFTNLYIDVLSSTTSSLRPHVDYLNFPDCVVNVESGTFLNGHDSFNHYTYATGNIDDGPYLTYLDAAQQLDWANYPLFDPLIWAMTPEGLRPKISGARYVSGYYLVGNQGIEGRTVQVQSLHHGHSKILAEVMTAEGGYFNIPLGRYSYPVMLQFYDGVSDAIEPAIRCQVGDKLLPIESNGTYLECTVEGVTGQVIGAVPLSGEFISGSATFDIKPLNKPAIEGPMLPAINLDSVVEPA